MAVVINGESAALLGLLFLLLLADEEGVGEQADGVLDPRGLLLLPLLLLHQPSLHRLHRGEYLVLRELMLYALYLCQSLLPLVCPPVLLEDVRKGFVRTCCRHRFNSSLIEAGKSPLGV